MIPSLLPIVHFFFNKYKNNTDLIAAAAAEVLGPHKTLPYIFYHVENLNVKNKVSIIV